MTDEERAIAMDAAEVRALGAEPFPWEELPDRVRRMWIREAQLPGPAQWPPVAAAMWREDQVASEPTRRTAGAREPDEPRVYGAKEAAEALGVMQTNLRVVKGLPEPYAVVAASTLWRADDIDELACRRRARKTGAWTVDEITYYWSRDDFFVRRVGYRGTEIWLSREGSWERFEIKPWNMSPLTVEDAIDRLVRTGEWNHEGPSPFGPGVHRAPPAREEECREEPGERVRYENPQTGEYIDVEFI